MSKPVKKTVNAALAALPQSILDAIEAERTKEQTQWTDATADLIRQETGLSPDIAFVAAKRSRETYTAHAKALQIAEVLAELQAYR